MADILNESAVQQSFSSFGPFGSLIATIFTMIGGFVGLYVILLIIRYFEDKKLKKMLLTVVHELTEIRMSMVRIERKLGRRR